jgi:hypothetical protein
MAPDAAIKGRSLPSLCELRVWNDSCSFHDIGQRRESAQIAP